MESSVKRVLINYYYSYQWCRPLLSGPMTIKVKWENHSVIATGERLKIMRGTNKLQQPLVWFEHGGWWFKVLGECFGPYKEMIEARYNLLVIQGLSFQLRQAISH